MRNKQMSGCVKCGKPTTTLIQAVMKMSKRELRKLVLDLILGNYEEPSDHDMDLIEEIKGQYPKRITPPHKVHTGFKSIIADDNKGNHYECTATDVYNRLVEIENIIYGDDTLPTNPYNKKIVMARQLNEKENEK